MKILKNSLIKKERNGKVFFIIERNGYEFNCIHFDRACNSKCPAFDLYKVKGNRDTKCSVQTASYLRREYDCQDDSTFDLYEVCLSCVSKPIIFKFEEIE